MKPWMTFLLSVQGAMLFFALAAITGLIIYRMNVRKKKREKKNEA